MRLSKAVSYSQEPYGVLIRAHFRSSWEGAPCEQLHLFKKMTLVNMLHDGATYCRCSELLTLRKWVASYHACPSLAPNPFCRHLSLKEPYQGASTLCLETNESTEHDSAWLLEALGVERAKCSTVLGRFFVTTRHYIGHPRSKKTLLTCFRSNGLNRG